MNRWKLCKLMIISFFSCALFISFHFMHLMTSQICSTVMTRKQQKYTIVKFTNHDIDDIDDSR